jgi:uncharacterized protein (DUF1800 family)
MPFTRRQFLTLSSVAGAAALLAGCRSPAELLAGLPPPAAWPSGRDPAWHALSRLTFGPRADERAHVAEIGLAAWIDEQLAPEQLDDRPADLRVRRFDILTMDSSLIFDVREANARRQLQQATLLRAVYSRRQLYELMVDFWSDHFSISTAKGDGAWLKPIDDRAVIRPYALGSFRDLLWASLHSPAMLQYLDNHANYRDAPNENYARELMELHTLGVQAGYTQGDVRELARCLTGWTVDQQLFRGQFRFDPAQHDDGAKQVLGLHIPAGGGQHDVEQVFEQLLAHPALPQQIARKLVRRFVADDPPPQLVAAVATTFTRTRGEIKAVLRTLLHAPEFATAPPKFKRPLHYLAGALRQLNANTNGGPPLLEALVRMGQPLFMWPTPDGFPDATAAWSGGLLTRWQLALALATNALPGTSIDLDALMRAAGTREAAGLLDRLGTLLLGAPLAPAVRGQVAGALAHTGDDRAAYVAALLAAPAYQWR